MSEISPYGITQHAAADGPVTADALVGDRAGSTNVNAIGDVGPAMFSTAPYEPPLTERGARGCYHGGGTCAAPAMRGRRVCFFHSQDAK